ncbi:lamin tail-like protein [Neolewinella xylanilytica]|uniref:Lamin tail-like protein n=1 Tax=Neolewinella xylanilytica TaxID=1514080 RepID=A0A2S6I115_9BACT|nr:lamin tail domain-containing protein [Neolewinella xylanilytica]PPK84652.1 lamin tail-like protein [Neolewinella xylanilytica]
MRRIYSLFPWSLFVVLIPCTRAPAQTIYLQQGFEEAAEENLPYAPDITPYGSGAVPTWNRVEQLPGITAPANGNFFWAARDVDNATSGREVARLRFEAGNICSLTSARFVFAYNVQGYDAGDDFGYELFLDGFPAQKEVLIDGKNGGGISTDGWVYHAVAIPGTAQTAALEIFFDQNGDDVAAVDHVQVIASGDDGNCQPVCGIRLGQPRLNCLSFTDDPDVIRLSLPYSGAEIGAVVYSSAGTVGGDDPAVQPDGTIIVDGYTEGGYALLRIRGGDCEIDLPLEFLTDQCLPSDVVINEVLAAPAHDANGDGVVDGGDEFVEIYNTGAGPFDLSGHTVHDGSNSGPRFTFPASTELGAGESFVIFASAADAGSLQDGCRFGTASGFLGLNDDGPESVILRDADGRVVAQVDFDDAPDGESLTLSPDGNLAGGYHPHGAIDGGAASACGSFSGLPVVLKRFSATPLYDAVRLDWETAVEVDNWHFVVERSKAGVAFEAIGRVPAGKGSYVYVDENPYPGQNYYRLRQLDMDGQETLYGPVSVRLDSGLIRLFPNPTSGRMRISGDIDEAQVYEVFYADGRRALTGRGNVLEVAHLPAGVYYLRLPRRSDVASLRFMKE